MACGFCFFSSGRYFIILYPIVKGKNTRCSAQAQGTLEEIRKGPEDPPRNWYSYAYRVNGVEYQLETPDRSPQARQVGDPCTIWYNPDKPKEALAFRYSTNRFFRILLISGIVMVLLGIALPILGIALQAR